jgi:deaminated glutathione amidase
MTENATLGVAQFAPTADTSSNRETVAALADSAVAQGATLVVFPEYSSYFTTQMGRDWVDAAEKIDGEFASALAETAARLGVYLIAGMLEQTSDSARASNTLLAFSPDGSLVAKYRKIHLYDAFGSTESDWIVAGPIEEPEIFAWGGFTVGLQTCYDIRFPEVSRRLVDAGADLIVLPAEWVNGPNKVAHWRTLITARAIENTVYIAAADHCPPIGAGNSMIVDPMGIELVTIADEQGVALAEISPQRVLDVRKTNPSLTLRRL